MQGRPPKDYRVSPIEDIEGIEDIEDGDQISATSVGAECSSNGGSMSDIVWHIVVQWHIVCSSTMLCLFHARPPVSVEPLYAHCVHVSLCAVIPGEGIGSEASC